MAGRYTWEALAFLKGKEKEWMGERLGGRTGRRGGWEGKLIRLGKLIDYLI